MSRNTNREDDKNGHPAERQPLFNKLEHQHTYSPWHNEALEYSKTGRKLIDMIMNALRSLFG
ncbi:MAG: hypothetical protein E6L03_08995 [Thaumarchaeota archaeon]|nr:MAG: hypothetical protein E6L03_08995 [Nitrososphaerota archaeon]